MPSGSNPPPEPDPLEALAEEFIERVRAGEDATVEAYVHSHPHLADRIHELFPTLLMLEELKPSNTLPGEAAAKDTHASITMPTTIDDLRIVRVIGEGGMGTVYEARDSMDERVAVKVIHPHLLARPSLRERFAQEIEAGMRVTHPGVVRTLGAGSWAHAGGETPYIVLEYLEGLNLNEFLQQVGSVSERMACEIGARVAEALQAIHDAGMVHRDVKPENIVIAPDEAIKLTDLGVALILDTQQRMTQAGEFVGTLLYAAPEQMHGETATPATDLYALGLVLYQLVVGRHAFAEREVLSRARAPSLRAALPHVSSFLDKFVGALLARDPQARPDRASLVATTLDLRESSPWWTECQSGVSASFRQLTARESTPFVGREAERSMLDDALREARAYAGPIRCVYGEAGIGKSRLLREWTRQIHERGDAHVLAATFEPLEELAGLTPLNRALCEHVGSVDLEQRLARLLGEHAAMAPAFAHDLLGHAASFKQPMSESARLSAWAHVLRAIAADGPLVFIAEDLHFASVASRQLVHGLAYAIATDPILMVVSSRGALPNDVSSALNALDRFSAHELTGLTYNDSLALVECALPDDAARDSDVRQLIGSAEGNPYCLIEFARELKGKRNVPREGPVPLPASIQDLVELRLAAVPSAIRSVLNVAACCGHRFDPEMVCEVAGVSKLAGLRMVHAADRDHQLVYPEGDAYVFSHHLVQDVLHRELPQRLREATHLELGAMVRSRGSADAYAISRHYVLGGDARPALPFAEAAVEHARAMSEYRQGVRLASAFIDVLEQRDSHEGGAVPRSSYLLASLQLLRGMCLSMYAPADDVLASLDAARELEESHRDQSLACRVQLELAKHQRRSGDYQRAEASGRLALEMAETLGDARLRSRAASEVALCYEYFGRKDKAVALAERGVTEARAVGDGSLTTRAMWTLGRIQLALGRMEEAQVALEQSVAVSHLYGESAIETDALEQLGTLAFMRADMPHSVALTERVLEIAQRTGDARLATRTQTTLAATYLQLGEFETSLTHARAAKRMGGRLGYTDIVSHALLSEGQTRIAMGYWDEAMQLLEAGRELVANKTPLLEARLSTSPALLLAWCGQFEEAERLVARGFKAARDAEAPRETLLMRMVESGLLDVREQWEALASRLRGVLEHFGEGEVSLDQAQIYGRLGVTYALLDQPDKAREPLEASRHVAETYGLVGHAALMRAWLAMLPEASVLKARTELETWDEHISAHGRVRAWTALGERSGRIEDLRRARHELERIVQRAPAPWQHDMRTRVPLHARVLSDAP